jgi:hypothetical protein
MKVMKKERFLLSVLWMNAMALFAAWFFNVSFGFNMFRRSHWRYLSELQISGVVDGWFYISIAGLAVVGIVGMYLMIVPWHRRIRIQKTGFVAETSARSAPAAASQANPLNPSKPPRLNLNNVFIPTKRERAEIPVSGKPAVEAVRPEKIGIIKDMLARAGFVAKNPPSIDGIRPDFWAIGADEALVVGLFSDESGEITAAEGGKSVWSAAGRSFQSPVWRLTSAVQSLEALFLEVVDDGLKINVLPFVFSNGHIANKDGVRAVWDALGVRVFDDIGVFGDFLESRRSRELGEDELGDFGAFSDFIDTVSDHFDRGGS